MHLPLPEVCTKLLLRFVTRAPQYTAVAMVTELWSGFPHYAIGLPYRGIYDLCLIIF